MPAAPVEGRGRRRRGGRRAARGRRRGRDASAGAQRRRIRCDRETLDGAAAPRLRPPARRRPGGHVRRSRSRRARTDRTTLEVVVDRLRIEGDLRSRLTDSIETSYREGGGAAFAMVLGRDQGSGSDDRDPDPRSRSLRIEFSERFECRTCGIAYETPQPRLFSFNNPFGACPTCHGFGNIIELDMDLVVPDPSKSINQGAIEPWSKPHYRAQLAELKRAARKSGIRLDVPWADLTDEERTFVVEGDGAYDGIRGFFRWLERKKYKVHVRVFLSRYRGYLPCPDCGGARLRREARDVRVGGRTIDAVSALTVREAQQFFAEPAAQREGSGGRRQGAARDPAAPVVPERRRARLPDARSAVVDALGRRIAAHQPGDVARLGAGRHALRARRAVDRSALARQPAAHRHPAAAARPGQHRARRRARRGHDSRRRSHRRHRPRRRRAGRQGRLLGRLPGTAAGAAVADGEVSAERAGDSGALAAPQGPRAQDSVEGRDRAQPQGRRHRDPAEHADLRHRRQRLGQVHARARRAVRGDQAREGRLGSARRHVPRAAGARIHHRRRARRSDADRPHAAIESGDLSQGLRSDPRAVRVDEGRAGRAASPRATSRSTCPAAAARRARARAKCASRCSSSPTSSCRASSATACASSRRCSRCATRARTSTRCST